MPAIKLLVVLLGACALTACSSSTVPDPDPTETVGGNSDADTGGYNDDGFNSGEDVPFAGELTNIIYFDFDSSEVRSQDTDIVTRHAVQLSSNLNRQVRLEGHADERGSREYNIGLGERRAQAVRRLLLIQGVSASQISTVSFGEERPASNGSNESAYARNRRVEIQYTGN